MTEHRETYYELHLDGEFVHKGSYESCLEESLYPLNDNRTEIYKVVVTEERIR